ncbi:MAG: PocR ligand-binding domain-containing protein [Anaerolineaceae bacterium]|nr:PocR ligand-binding domain-containing protein [Anaerolineaceae bacterium]
MVDLLTVRQVQDILQVDRITIYRMLQDGRLRGSKIGQQWRFTRHEVERLIKNDSPAPTLTEEGDKILPVHCIQTVQDLFSNVSRLGAVVADLNGQPVTQASNLCALCSLVLSTPGGQTACRECWSSANPERKALTCHAGLRYLTAPVTDGGEVALYFLVGGFYFGKPDPEAQEKAFSRLSKTTGLPLESLRMAAESVPVVVEDQQAEVEAWPQQAVNAVESILLERTNFIERLKKIAHLTQLG